MPNLYEITSAFPALMENEEISEVDKEKIEEELTMLLQQKSKNIIAYTRNEEITIEAMKLEEKRLAEIRKAKEKRLENFKKYVKECMENNSIEKIQTELGTLSLAKNPISVEIIDESKIPEQYKENIITVKVDKKAIADNFKSTGELIDGVVIHTDKTSLRVK